MATACLGENDGISVPDLLAQFEDQQCYYSKPLECQSKTAAQKLVDRVTSLRAELKTQESLYGELVHTRPGDDNPVCQLESQEFMGKCRLVNQFLVVLLDRPIVAMLGV